MTPAQIEKKRDESASRSQNGHPTEQALYWLSAAVLEIALQLAIKNNAPAAAEEARKYGAMTMRQHIESLILNYASQATMPPAGTITAAALRKMLHDLRAAISKVPA